MRDRDREKLEDDWRKAPSLVAAEALETHAEATGRRVEDRTLAEWLTEPHLAGAITAFGPAAIPGVCRAATSGSAVAREVIAGLLPSGAASSPSSSFTLVASLAGTLIACVQAGALARAQLELPPGVHTHGGREALLAHVLVGLGPSYVPELLLLVERTMRPTHGRIVHELRSRYGRAMPAELMPVLGALLATEAAEEAAWLACENHERAQPLVAALIGAIRPARRGVLSALGHLRVPADAVAIIEPLLDPLETKLGSDSNYLVYAVIEALAACEPAPVHLTPRFATALARARELDDTILAKHLIEALAKIAPDQVVATLAGLSDVATYARKELAIACLGSGVIPEAMRLAWTLRLLAESSDGARIARQLVEKGRPRDLIAPLCQQLERDRGGWGSSVTAIIEVLARFAVEDVVPELATLRAAPDATLRRRALDYLFAANAGDEIVRFLADPDPFLMRRAARWIVVHGGAQLLGELACER